ncbi:MAG: BREX-3 system phosphatase PglZ, partial [Treponema sp.]|nr:BREX-3 system phosphatase PglZ [Treponema sp.]
KIEKLFVQFENEIPSSVSDHRKWLAFMLKYAYLSSYVYRENNNSNIQKLSELFEKCNSTYAEWLINNFPGLITIPAITPAMVHHLPHYMLYSYFKTKKPQVLIIIDGLSLYQWVTLKEAMPEQKYAYTENALFAWVPTLTSVSRQALVSGKKPLEFAEYIYSTSKEESYWALFWENAGLQKDSIVYRKAMDDFDIIENIEEYIDPSKTRAVCLIINKVDDIMHGIKLGNTGLHNQIELYGKSGFLESLIESLLRYNFEITIASDHGNIDCIGIGNPKESSIAEIKGERARVFQNKILLDSVQKNFPDSFAWKPVSLPQNYYPLLSKGNTSFALKGRKSVSHGSISVQETIVPFIKVEGK